MLLHLERPNLAPLVMHHAALISATLVASKSINQRRVLGERQGQDSAPQGEDRGVRRQMQSLKEMDREVEAAPDK